jgi:hypothetical protein
MDASRAGNGRIFDLLEQPWRLLRLDPAAADQQIHAAFSRAQQNPMAATAALIFARDALLDPNRRLFYELAYPLDCPASEVDGLHAALSSDESLEELLNFSDQLWPLARANFIAHIASHRPANGSLLYALLESHAAMDATDIYARLKIARAAAGIPSPSWMSMNQELDELLHIHTAAVLAGYDTIQDAAEPVGECARRILANGERHFIQAMGGLLSAFRQSIGLLQTDLSDQIANACTALKLQPNDDSLLKELSNSVERWTSLSRPLLIWCANQRRGELDFETPIEHLRLLIASLAENEHYNVAVEVTEATRDFFSAVPTTIEQLAEDAGLIASLSKQANFNRLQSVIDELELDPEPLIRAMEKDGFGETSTEPAQRLWSAFVQAAGLANSTLSTEPPWQLMRDFAIRFSNKPEAAAAVVRLLSGLIEYGTRISAAPRVLTALRDNLDFMKSFMGTEDTAEGVEAIDSSKKESFFTKIWKKRSLRSGRVTVQPSPKRKIANRLTGVVLITALALSVAALHFGFDKARSLWATRLVARQTQPATQVLGAETIPSVGTGQHLALDGVR